MGSNVAFKGEAAPRGGGKGEWLGGPLQLSEFFPLSREGEETRVDLERFRGPSVRSFLIFFLFDRAQTLQALFGRSEMVGVAAP